MVNVTQTALILTGLLAAGVQTAVATEKIDDWSKVNVVVTQFDEAKCAERGGSYDNKKAEGANVEGGACYLKNGEDLLAVFGVKDSEFSTSKINLQEVDMLVNHFWPVPKDGNAASITIVQNDDTTGKIVYNVKLKTDCKIEGEEIQVLESLSQWDSDKDFPALTMQATFKDGFLTLNGSTSEIKGNKRFYQFNAIGALAKDKLCKEAASFSVVPADSWFGYRAKQSGNWRFGFGEDYKCKEDDKICSAAMPRDTVLSSVGTSSGDAPTPSGETKETTTSTATASPPLLWLAGLTSAAVAALSSVVFA